MRTQADTNQFYFLGQTQRSFSCDVSWEKRQRGDGTKRGCGGTVGAQMATGRIVKQGCQTTRLLPICAIAWHRSKGVASCMASQQNLEGCCVMGYCCCLRCSYGPNRLPVSWAPALAGGGRSRPAGPRSRDSARLPSSAVGRPRRRLPAPGGTRSAEALKTVAGTGAADLASRSESEAVTQPKRHFTAGSRRRMRRRRVGTRASATTRPPPPPRRRRRPGRPTSSARAQRPRRRLPHPRPPTGAAHAPR